MPQRQKQEVRASILRAAGAAFAERGLAGSSLTDIAARAGTSVGNVYKYFPDKAAVFDAVLPATIADTLRALVRRQVHALGAERDALALGADHPYRAASEDVLRFTLEHRDAVVFLLTRAEGTSYATLAADLAEELGRLALRYARAAYPGLTPTPLLRRSLSRAYRAFVRTLGALLVEEPGATRLRAAVAQLVVMHLSGLRALFLAESSGGGSEHARQRRSRR